MSEPEFQNKYYQSSDDELGNKYESAKINLLQRHERIKLPILAHDIYANPNYTTIDTDWSSTWNSVKQSRLIESLIVNIPVPPIILYEESYGKYKIIDGRERLKASADFYSNRLALTGLEIELELDGCTCATLPTEIRCKLDRRSLSLISVIPKSELSPDQVASLIKIVTERLGNK
ncbi:DUF262 domain-containing protein [Scytonema millei]|uniref:DUF262 domain-containing protein n=1 Tax=Scytonema millei VB511283 TaxID=1245923 RepID=A0A9X5I6A7_9CYAN|nr:DUF262 domain-containing protein [Scytonema millei]NHC36916.1 DUF262 domain-containing protein [Scytonema millei VB511283]